MHNRNILDFEQLKNDMYLFVDSMA